MMKDGSYIILLLAAASLAAGCSNSIKMVPYEEAVILYRKPSAPETENKGQYEVVKCNYKMDAAGEGCTRSGHGKRMVIQGDVLASNRIYQDGVVIIDGESGRIIYTGCDSESIHRPEETRIVCKDSVISPGMINAHEHITYSNGRPLVWGDERYEHRNDWRKGIHGHTAISGSSTSHNEVAEMRQMMGGTTSIFGAGKVNGLVRNLDEEMVRNVKGIYQTFPLGDAQNNDYPDNTCAFNYHESVSSFDESCPYGPHIGEGINEAAHNELVCLSGGNGGVDIFKPNLAVIHGVAASPDLIEKMYDRHVKMVWSPRTNISLYGDTAPITVYDNMGVTIGLGTDWIYSGSANMLRELQCVDYLNQNYYHHHFSDYDIWRMPTMGSALALGVSQFLGRIEKGYLADLVIYKKQDGVSPYRSVIQAQNKDIRLVMIDGKLIYGDESLIPSGETIDVCGVVKRFDAETAGFRELSSFSSHAAYPMFFCDIPEDEPSCVPRRVREEDTVRHMTSRYASVTAGDRDGDGVSDETDNCPDVFNPVRPQDKARVQSDFDGDGMGDMCDKYPACRENDSSCKIYTRDYDKDGIDDYIDNCPNDSNSDQSDTDDDNVGDVCDKCDDRYDRDGDGIADNCDKCADDGRNEDGLGCSLEMTSIGSIRRSIAEDTFKPARVKVSGIVTAIGARGFFIEDAASHAGLYIYGDPNEYTFEENGVRRSVSELSPDNPKLYYEAEIIGDAVFYYGFVELKDISLIRMTETHDVSVSPAEITAMDVVRDSDDKISRNILDSSLVTVNDLTVVSFERSKKNNYAVARDSAGHEVYIDDFLMGEHELFERLAEGKTYHVTGVIVYDYGKSKLAPRNAADIRLK